MDMENILHVKQKSEWETLLKGSRPVLVDFWAEWCAPCRMLTPTLEKLAEKYGKDIAVAKINVDELPELGDQFAVRAIPTLILLHQGKVVERLMGLRPYDELAGLLEKHVPAPVRVN